MLYNHFYTYLSGVMVERFADESTWQFSRIVKKLWINGISVNEALSGLDLQSLMIKEMTKWRVNMTS
jgi:hypothetical protein